MSTGTVSRPIFFILTKKIRIRFFYPTWDALGNNTYLSLCWLFLYPWFLLTIFVTSIDMDLDSPNFSKKKHSFGTVRKLSLQENVRH